MSRTKIATKNIKFAIGGQIIGIVIGFIARIFFIRTLGQEYLGLNGLFTNILSILSLAELGVGPAIVYSMYKPLAEDDRYKVKALMNLYKRSYISIGCAIAFIGIGLTPFLEFFIKELPDIERIRLIYLMFVANSAISYFFSYKRSLIIADQKRYIATFYKYVFYLILNILQILVLIYTKNYILFLVLLILSTTIENICVSIKADKMYPFLKDKSKASLSSSEKKSILQNIKAMMYHKFGTTIVMGTDNLLISKFVGLVEVGLYSNYLFIKNALNTMYGLLFQSITASIGNLGATESIKKRLFIFKCINFAGYYIYAFSSICLMVLFNPFIEIWAGSSYLFPMEIVFLIVLNFYVTGMRKSVLTFRDALGLFWHDRYKPLFESLVNLLVSLLLVKSLGIRGILLGTTVSTITVCFWIEPLILYKNGFKNSVTDYFITYFKYLVVLVVVGGITYGISAFVFYTGFVGLLIKSFICLIVPNTLFVLIFRNSLEFKYFYDLVFKKAKLKGV